MRAMQSEQAELAEFVAKQHQLFAENFDRLGNVVEILRNSNYYPVPAKPFAARRSRPHLRNIRHRHALVLLFALTFATDFSFLLRFQS